jgi:hypothetical protein
MDPLLDFLSICLQAYNASFCGIYKNYVDFFTYASLIITIVYMPPSRGIIHCKPILIGEVM